MPTKSEVPTARKTKVSVPKAPPQKTHEELFEMAKKFATKDYQNRGNNWPASGKPDQIQVSTWQGKITISCSFKNTSESDAKNFVQRHLAWTEFMEAALAAWYEMKLGSGQQGDYHDDWVQADAMFSVPKKESAE